MRYMYFGVWLIEQLNDIQVATHSCNRIRIIAITWIKLKHNNSTALERSVINNWGGLNRFYRRLTSTLSTAVVHI